MVLIRFERLMLLQNKYQFLVIFPIFFFYFKCLLAWMNYINSVLWLQATRQMWIDFIWAHRSSLHNVVFKMTITGYPISHISCYMYWTIYVYIAFRPITLTVAKCWDPTPKGYFTLPPSKFKLLLTYFFQFFSLQERIEYSLCVSDFLHNEEMLVFPSFASDNTQPFISV